MSRVNTSLPPVSHFVFFNIEPMLILFPCIQLLSEVLGQRTLNAYPGHV